MRERKYIQLLTPFYCWTKMCSQKATTFFHIRLEAGSARRGWERTNSHSFAPVSISMITLFSEQAQVLLFRQTLPQIQIQTPTVCSANQPTNYGWNGNQRKQHSLVKSPKAFFIEFNISECFFFKCKSSEFIQTEAASRD